MVRQKNFAIYLDGNIVCVTMNKQDMNELMEDLRVKYPNSKVTYSIWYD